MHIINKVFKDFEDNNIRYCHFKSNQHLNESFNGTSDFDVLVDYKKSNDCEKILLNNNCKRFEPNYIGTYPGVVNWISFDEETGKIFHLHLHYQLASGRSLVKEYILPWGELLLRTAIRSKEFKIFVSNPNVEVLLLLTRIVIKSGIRIYLKSFFGFYKLSCDMEREYKYLRELINENELRTNAKQMFSPINAERIINIVMESTTIRCKQFKQLNCIIKEELRVSRRMNLFLAMINSKLLRVIDLKNKLFSRKLGKYYITKKVTPSGGKIIAFIGVDGCGKSTLTREITSWLNYKIEVKRFYMGEGDGKVNIFAYLVKKLYSLIYSKRTKTNTPEKIKTISLKSSPKKYIKKYVHALLIFSIVKSNKKKILKMHRYRMNGGFSVLDRYPQLQHEGMNDGLKLGIYARELRSKIISKLACREQELMNIVNDVYPDLVFRLNISPEVSMQRKPEEQTNYEAIKIKADACKTLVFKKSELVEVDGEQNLDDVILQVKRKIWSGI